MKLGFAHLSSSTVNLVVRSSHDIRECPYGYCKCAYCKQACVTSQFLSLCSVVTC